MSSRPRGLTPLGVVDATPPGWVVQHNEFNLRYQTSLWATTNAAQQTLTLCFVRYGEAG
jgi:hypothetical protein